MSHEYCQEIINDFEKLLTTEIGYDVIIYAGENENIKEIHAHSNILSTRSLYFCTAFSNEWAKKKDGKFIFNKPNVPPQIFEIILRFIYCGKIDLTKLRGPEVLKLLIAVDEFDIQSLITHTQEYLSKHQDEFLQQNPIEILEIKICKEPEMLFDSDKFINLKAPLLKLLLKRDDLNLDEIVVWNSLLKWSIAQNPTISQDSTKWSKDEITIMERTLHEFIPLIRFYHISSDDFLDKIFPLKKLLPEDLVDDLLKFHIAPNRKPNVNNIQPPRLEVGTSFGHRDSSILMYNRIIIKEIRRIRKILK
ncbi:BTB/POZ protein [Glomus cerebriforme]|uniref:BTB/POZ protein n=1 Tax=Glomus cerebriforme TaxID=658196 RepID=A0A397SAP3_9GLOM|nr:BTB/POZ protein [Glomus cerebriforme]